ncbi:MAG: hypothetical protein C4343_01420 [Chloroflexota bacterium]
MPTTLLRHRLRIRPLRALALALAGCALGTLAPATALGHSLEGRYESPLPLAVYVVGAAIAVALSFAIVLVRDVRSAPPALGEAIVLPEAVRIGLRILGLAGWGWVVAQGIAGGGGAADVGSLFLWVYGWVGLAMISALGGPIWVWLNPFATLYDLGARLLRRAGIRGGAAARYPAALAEWPAVGGYVFFVWLELVFTIAGSGRPLAVVLIAYTVLTLLAMAQWGRDVWLARGEVFSVWFGLLGRLAPWALDGSPAAGRLRRQPLGAGLARASWTLPLVVLVASATGAILYDGLSQTTVWLDLFGLPSTGEATLLLLGFLGLLTALVLAVGVRVGWAAIGTGLLPIAVGYLVAHYLTYLLLDGQRIVIAVSDPLQRGWDLFGTAFYKPSLAWLPPSLVWTVQLVAVVGGHMVGAWAGHVAAARSVLRLRQIPLAALMVLLTATTLWSLGQVIVVSGGGSAAVGVLAGGMVATATGRASIARGRHTLRPQSVPAPIAGGRRGGRGTRGWDEGTAWRGCLGPVRSALDVADPYPEPLPVHRTVRTPTDVGQRGSSMASMTVRDLARVRDFSRARELGPMLTASEVAELLHLHVNTVKRLGDRGELPFYRVCKRGDRRYRLEDVLEFLTRNT